MAEKLPIADLSRQPLVRGTSCFTDPSGTVGFKTEDIQTSALVRIADALEKQSELIQATRPGFTAAQWEDGLNHFHAVQAKGERLVRIDVLATSPAMARQLTDDIAAVLNAAMAVAAAQEGGQADG